MLNPNLIARLPRPISCRLLAPLLTRYVEAAHSLSPAERQAVANHLHGCSACAEETEAIQMMGNMLRERAPAILPVTVPSADLWDRIEARIIAEEVSVPSVRAKKSLQPALIFAPAFAALVVAAVVVPKTMQHNTPTLESTASRAVQAPGGVPVIASPETQEQKPEMAIAATSKAVAPMAGKKFAAPAPAPAESFASASDTAPAPALADKVAPVARATARPMAKQMRLQKQAVQVALQPRTHRAVVAVRPSVARPSAPPIHRQHANAQYAVIEIVPVPSPKPRVATQVAVNKPSRYEARETFDAPDSRSSAAYFSASRNMSVAKPKPFDAIILAPSAIPAPPVAPKTNEPLLANLPGGINMRTITVVESDPGPGVPESAKKPSTSVTETLIRSRQRRGLFGGYGAGMTAMMPAGMTPKKNEAGEPW